MSDTRHGRVAQLEKHAESCLVCASARPKFADYYTFPHCCARGRAHSGSWATRPHLVSSLDRFLGASDSFCAMLEHHKSQAAEAGQREGRWLRRGNNQPLTTVIITRGEVVVRTVENCPVLDAVSNAEITRLCRCHRRQAKEGIDDGGRGIKEQKHAGDMRLVPVHGANECR